MSYTPILKINSTCLICKERCLLPSWKYCNKHKAEEIRKWKKEYKYIVSLQNHKRKDKKLSTR